MKKKFEHSRKVQTLKNIYKDISFSLKISSIDLFIVFYIKTSCSIGLHHPLDGVTNPEYKLLHFIQLTNFL
jgi:hypothetical protein